MTDTVLGWWFSAGRRLPRGDGRRIALGKTHRVAGEIVPCRNGLHLCPDILDALGYATGPILWRVRGAGEIIRDGGKVVCSARTYLAGGVDVSDALRHFARLCALDVADMWGAQPATKRFLRTGDPALRAAAYDDVIRRMLVNHRAGNAADAAGEGPAYYAATRTACAALRAAHAALRAAADFEATAARIDTATRAEADAAGVNIAIVRARQSRRLLHLANAALNRPWPTVRRLLRLLKFP